MNNVFKSLILLEIILMTGCSMLDRRDHENIMNDQFTGDMWVPEEDFPIIPGDTGRSYRNKNEIMNRVPATARNQRDIRFNKNLQQEIVHLENKLSDREYDDYQQIKPQLGGLSEQIYFLRLTYREKLEYMRARNIHLKASYSMRNFNQYQFSAQNQLQPVGIGMSKSEVLARWGSPDERMYAGSPMEQNEKWAYRQNGKNKYIYFEHGRVEGWTEQ